MSLIERDVEPGLLVVFDLKYFSAAIGRFLVLDAAEFANPIIDMNNEIAVIEFPQTTDLLTE